MKDEAEAPRRKLGAPGGGGGGSCYLKTHSLYSHFLVEKQEVRFKEQQAGHVASQ